VGRDALLDLSQRTGVFAHVTSRRELSGSGCATIRSAVGKLIDPRLPCTVGAAEVLSARLHAMANDRHLAVVTARREHMNRACEGIKRMCGASDRHVEGLVVRIAAALAGFHAASICKLCAADLLSVEHALLHPNA
jgi:hypothetical protein